jgi:hypothetical protein
MIHSENKIRVKKFSFFIIEQIVICVKQQTEAEGMSYHAANFGGNVINTTADMGLRTSVAFSLPHPV